MRPFWVRFLTAVGIALLLATMADTAVAAAPPAAAAPAAATMAEEVAKAAEYIGESTCRDCHKREVISYKVSTHSKKIDPRTPAGQHSCETCHGAGSTHAEKPLKTNILTYGKKSTSPVSDQNATCLECHSKGKQKQWMGSIHEQRGLACSSCHNVHGGQKKNLRFATESDVCTSCHKDVKAQLRMSSHHPIREGKVTCSNCHNPHGTSTEKLISADNINTKCFECHAEKRGPVLHQHPPVPEGCLNCHKPHGSNHNKLLTQRAPFLCQTCHSRSSGHGMSSLHALTDAQTALNVNSAGVTRLINKGCVNCHVQIHGSNHPSGQYFTR